ncbi:MAG TPA: secretin N-terminal domain-containing protein, partial [Burkholderiales bacterium]
MRLRGNLVLIVAAALIGQAQAQPAAPGSPAPAQPSTPDARPQAQPAATDTVTLNFVNADIEGVVRAVSEITGKNFLIDPRVKGTVSIVSARPMARALVYEVFLSALRLQGFAAVEDRGVVKIVPEADAKLHPGRTIGPQEGSRGSGDQMQTRVFTLTHESAAGLLPTLRPLIAPANPITVYAGSNTLVITDYAGNLQRIAKIIDAIDQPGGSDPVMIPLRHASAVDVALTVNRLLAAPGQAAAGAAPDASQRLSVVADARSNSLVAQSDNPSRIARLRSLAAMLDSPTTAAGNLHVVYLKNADAVKVAETLRAIYLGEMAPAPAPRGVALPAAASAAGAPPAPSPLAPAL